MSKCLIKREDRPGFMLQGIGIGCFTNSNTEKIVWTHTEFYAYKAENEETAQAMIDFIRDVIDWELAERLTITPILDKKGSQC